MFQVGGFVEKTNAGRTVNFESQKSSSAHVPFLTFTVSSFEYYTDYAQHLFTV